MEYAEKKPKVLKVLKEPKLKKERTPEQIQAAKDKMALVRAKKTQKVGVEALVK